MPTRTRPGPECQILGAKKGTGGRARIAGTLMQGGGATRTEVRTRDSILCKRDAECSVMIKLGEISRINLLRLTPASHKYRPPRHKASSE